MIMKETLEQQRAMETGALSGIGVIDGCAIRGGVDSTVLGTENLLGGHYERRVLKTITLNL